MAFEWYFRLNKPAQRRTNACIRMLVHVALMTPEQALDFIYQNHNRR